MNGTTSKSITTATAGGNHAAVNLPRRALLLTAGAAAALPAAVMPAAAETGPDAELIRLCAEHPALVKLANSGIEPNGDGPVYAALYRAVDAIDASEPQTMAGVLAKARVARMDDDRTLALGIVYDLLRLGGAA